MRHQNYSPGDENPGPMVTVVCDAESHAPKVAILAPFVKPAGGKWECLPAPGDGWATHSLFGDEINQDHAAGVEPKTDRGRGFRQRYALTCPLCGDSLRVRQERLVPVLDRLAQHADAWEIELTYLRARVVK